MPRAPSQRRDGFHQHLAQPGMLDAFDRLADERLDQQGLGLRLRNAASHEIELQILIERAGRRAVAALHVVSEDFQFRLVVGLGLLGQQQRPRHHLGVGLLRALAHDDLPWNTPWASSLSTVLNTSRLWQPRAI